MLDYVRKRAIEALKSPRFIVLATNGPAGLLASEFPCESVGLSLYILIPKTSDHLFNLEMNSTVTLVAIGWELKGEARIVSLTELDLQLNLLNTPDIIWCQLIQIDPKQIQFRHEEGWGNIETIDLI